MSSQCKVGEVHVDSAAYACIAEDIFRERHLSELPFGLLLGLRASKNRSKGSDDHREQSTVDVHVSFSIVQFVTLPRSYAFKPGSLRLDLDFIRQRSKTALTPYLTSTSTSDGNSSTGVQVIGWYLGQSCAAAEGTCSNAERRVHRELMATFLTPAAAQDDGELKNMFLLLKITMTQDSIDMSPRVTREDGTMDELLLTLDPPTIDLVKQTMFFRPSRGTRPAAKTGFFEECLKLYQKENSELCAKQEKELERVQAVRQEVIRLSGIVRHLQEEKEKSENILPLQRQQYETLRESRLFQRLLLSDKQAV
ncbi:unnamed protein product [Cyprideis torosa]|uniref:Uncharacterized protein n=1 Tax=Cyprideis torosa TaxID=163714 RepID=A0A7R8WIT8_9CRUS|nr:unnamed protein product [Cyprideis torosa]CAG0895184.1 unnamed protein product [Cyprideis torosa]